MSSLDSSRICPKCNRYFVPRNPRQKYCSKPCAALGRRETHKAYRDTHHEKLASYREATAEHRRAYAREYAKKLRADIIERCALIAERHGCAEAATEIRGLRNKKPAAGVTGAGHFPHVRKMV